jgi:hypothetical protein
MLTKIHLVVSTHKIRNAGTKSDPVIILAQNNQDVLHHTFHLDKGVEEGSFLYFTLDVTELQLQPYFDYVRIGLRGADAWYPDFAFVWGEEQEPNWAGHRIMPIGVEHFTAKLSTDESEGRLSIPLRRANLGGIYQQFQRLLVIVKNAEQRFAGSSGDILLRFHSRKGLLAELNLRHESLARPGGAFFCMHYATDLFWVNELTSIELENCSENAWLPQSLRVLAFDNQPDEYETVVPLVDISDWSATGLGWLSANPQEGEPKVLLYRAFL